MDPYTITVQGFGSPIDAARMFEAFTALINDNDAAARVSLAIRRETDKAAHARYAHRMEMLNR